MAREPYSPVPGVEPTGPSGQNLQIQANPAQFGGLQAQGLEKLGAGAEQAGSNLYQAAQQAQELTNEATARDRNTAYMQEIAGKSAKYFSLAGKDAVDGQAGFAADIAATQKKYAQGLNPQAMNYYNNASAYLMSRLTMSSASHAGAQSIQWQAQSHAANAEAVAQMGVLTPNDPHLVDTAANSLADSVEGELRARDSNVDPATIKTAQQKALGRYYGNVIKRQADSGNFQGAMDTFNRVQTKMDPDSITQIDGALKGVRDKFAVDSFIQKNSSLTGPDVQPAQQGLTPTKVMNGLIGTEGSGPNAVSPSGATGRAQIIRSTFNEYALPGESYANEDDRRAAAKRYVDDMWKKYPGDADRMAVGYFSGTGNIAPPGSPTPWKTNASDGISTTQQYVNRFANIVHAPQAYTMEADRMAQIRDSASKSFPGRPDLQREAVGQAWQEISQTNALQSKYEAESQKYVKDQQQSAGDQVMKSLMTPGSDPQKLISTIRDNPYLTYEQKNHLWDVVKAGGGEVGQHDVKTYGSGFYDAFQAIHAPEGSPNRITDPSQLWSRVGPNGDLTVAGMEKLTNEMKTKGTPEGEAETKMKAGALAYAKHEISLEKDFGTFKLRDPKGEDLFNVGFTPAFYKAYDSGIKEGKSPYQLLSKDSPDFIVDKLISGYKRSPQQIQQDMLSEEGGEGAAPAAGGAAKPAAVDLKSQGGIIAAYQGGKIDRAKASQLLIDAGFARAAPAAAAAPSLPGDNAR